MEKLALNITHCLKHNVRSSDPVAPFNFLSTTFQSSHVAASESLCNSERTEFLSGKHFLDNLVSECRFPEVDDGGKTYALTLTGKHDSEFKGMGCTNVGSST